MNFLTFDLGTTLYKVALFDESGNLLALERAVPPIEHPQPQWAELDAGQFEAVLIDAVRRLGRQHDLSDVAAVCTATQANTFLLWDEQCRPISNFILWSDQRALALVDELREVIPDGGPLLAVAKLLWLARHEPQLMEKARGLQFIGDFLSDTHATEAGVAALARFFDVNFEIGERGHLLLEKLGLPDIDLPHVLDAGQALDRFFRAEKFGLPRNCEWIVGTLDQYAGAIGTGTVTPGAVCETTGTVLAAVRCADRLRSDLPSGVIQGPGFGGDRFWQMSFSSSSANLLQWYRDSLTGRPSFEELTSLAAGAPPSDLVIEPYYDRGPIAAAFAHVTPRHSPGQVVRAIMQRVAMSLKKQVDDLCGGDRPSEIRSAGGAGRNDFWIQVKADCLGIPFVATECEEPTSLGAAMLAARAMGLGDLPELAKRWVRPRARFEPRS